MSHKYSVDMIRVTQFRGEQELDQCEGNGLA